MKKAGMFMNVKEIAELEKDIQDIKDVLNEKPFNQYKAMQIIEKHKSKDEKVAVVNSPLNPNFVPYQYATDEMLKNNLNSLIEYLTYKLLIETGKG